jgi:outer membrane protein assembly factor BamB
MCQLCGLAGLTFITLVTVPQVHAGPITDGNILVSCDRVLYEYTPAGSMVQSWPIPDNPASEDYAREVVADADGNVYVYNGTFDPRLSKLDPTAGTWSHRSYAGWSTVNNLSYGGLAVHGHNLYATDMATAGAGSPQGVVQFDLNSTTTSRFATDIEPIDLTIGLDGLLYVLYPGGSPGGRTIDVYYPTTMQYSRSIDLYSTPADGGQRAIAVNGDGEIFLVNLGGDVWHLDANGALLGSADVTSITGTIYLYDVEVAPDGTVVVGHRDGGFLISDESLASFTPVTVTESFEGAFLSFVPEPASGLLFLLAGCCTILRRRRR